MPNIDMNEYEAAEASSTEEYRRMPAGGYVVIIMAVRTVDKERGVDYVNDKQYVKLIWDVAEGEFCGKFSDEYWADKDYGHQLYWSWKNMDSFKRTIRCFDESNPGFDALSAFRADKWELFVGKKIGIVVGEEEYMGNDGNVKTRFGFARMKSVQDIRDGRFRVPPLKKLEGYEEPSAPSTYEDVPF